MNRYIKLKFTNYESKSLLELLKILCEEIIPYYSKVCATKVPSMFRVADVKVKSDADKLKDIQFYKINNDIYYFGVGSIYKINIENRSCTCRWNMSYATCKHIYKYFFLRFSD